MSLLITTNDLKYKDIVLDIESVLLTLEPLLSTEKKVTIINSEGNEEILYQVRTNVYVTENEDSKQRLEIDGISSVYYTNFINANDLNIQYIEIHQDLIKQLETQNLNWVGKISEYYIPKV